MTYLSGRFEKRKSYTRYIVMAALFIVVIFFWPYIKRALYPVLEPAVLGYGGVKSSFTIFPDFVYTYTASRKTLTTKQKELELEVERLENKIADQDALLREMSLQLTGEELVTTPGKKSKIVMYPLMQDITSIYSTIVLSKGFKDGLEIGKIVTLRGNQAVCTVKEVYTSSSLCILLTSSGNVVEGVTSSSSITLSLSGRGSDFLANTVRDTPVITGETVYLKSDPSLILGTVQAVINNDQDTSWHVFVSGGYNPVTSSVFYVQP